MKVIFAKSDDGWRCSWRAELNEVEAVVNGHVQAWREGRARLVGPELDAVQARWRALGPGDELTVEWPTRRLAKPSSRDRRVPTRRRGVRG